MFVANPITRTINAVKVSDGEHGGYKLERLEDFLTCDDEWFRPIAISFGPDGCLYITDWYNKIISHNEVSRKHPDRDKTRGRVWRVRHISQTERAVPDIGKLPNARLDRSAQVGFDLGEACCMAADRVSATPDALAPELSKLRWPMTECD